jgi:DNA-binding XRE family transcriptional regulator
MGTIEGTAESRDPKVRREGKRVPNNSVQQYRESLMMSKAELARKAGLSTLTIDRVEAGRPCRLDTKRKILLALGFGVSDKDRVFGVGGEDRSVSRMPGIQPEREAH